MENIVEYIMVICMNKKGAFKRFIPYYKKHKLVMTLDLICASLTTLCELVLPMIVREITDAAVKGAAALTVDLITKSAILYVILRIIDTAAQYYMASAGHIMGVRLENNMRRDLFSHLQKLSFSYYDNTKVGTLMSRLTNDLFDISELAHHCPEEIFIAGIKIIASFIILCTMNVPLTLITFASIPLMVAVLVYFRLKMKKSFLASRIQVGEFNADIEDSLSGVRVVRSFAREDAEQEKFESGNRRYYDIKKQVYYVMAAFQASTRFFDGLMYIVVVIAGALFLLNDKISAADYVAYLMFVTTLLASIKTIVGFAEQFQRGMSGIERFAEVMNIEPEIKDEKGAKDITKVKGEVEFKEVSFGYGEGGGDVISDLNLRVAAGESIALVGPSGGGKTTLCSLIPRFYDVSRGQIFIDGKDTKDITLRSLRENIGVVAQDVYLFSGSVKENIAYGKVGATDSEIEKAARLAGAHEFITELPDGYDTYVGERGVKLSGGQKQRISIARVFLKNPPILILDEATSALDNESERLVQKSLEELAKGRTTFTIAHRLTTIKNADRIIYLTENGIEESGTHEELIAKKGAYQKLYELYSAN